MNYMGRRAKTAVGLAMVIGMPGIASAQTASNASRNDDDILVVATKTATPSERVPQSTSVVTRDELDARGVQDFNGAVAYTPGVRVVDYPGGQGAPDIYLRGFRTLNFLGIYRDGLRGGFNAYDGIVEPYAIERIEVLRGPASVLYGQGLPGGIVNMTTKRPTTDVLRELSLQTGSHDRYQGAVDLGGPVSGDGRLLYRLTAMGRRADTQVDYTHDDRAYVAPAVTWQPTSDTHLTVLGSYLYSLGGGSEQSLPTSGTINPNPNGKVARSLFLGEPEFNRSRIDNYALGYVFDHSFNAALTLRSTTRYQYSIGDYRSMGAVSGALIDDRRFSRLPQARHQTSHQILTDNSLEARFQTGAIEHVALIGIDYSHYDRNEQRRNGAITAIDIFAPVYGQPVVLNPVLALDNRYEIAQTGLYAQEQLRLGGWALTAGFRHDWAKTVTRSLLANRTLTQNDRAFTGRVGLLYSFGSGLTPYVSYSTSFVPQAAATRFDGATFNPTKGKQIEGGLKYQAPGTRDSVTASVFRIDQTNVLTTDPLHLGYFVETGEVRSQGVEMEGHVYFAPNFSMLASYSYTDAKVTRDNPDRTGVSRLGYRLPTVPRHMASAWLDYTAPSGSLDGLGVAGGVRYMSSSYDATNTDRAPGYALFDAAIRYDLGKLIPSLNHVQLAINATNLFDKRYYTPGFYKGVVFAGNNRNILATLTYRL